MLVKEIMTKRVDFVDPDLTLIEASKLMLKDDIGCLPVGENDRLVGIITDRDIVIRAVAEGRAMDHTTVRDAMSRPIKYCYEDETVEALAENFARNQIHRLPVLNHDKRLVGIVSLADLSTKGPKDAACDALCGICQPMH